MLKNALVRTPSPELINGITRGKRDKADYQKALQQHEQYQRLLVEQGISVTVLEANSSFPDSVFVEDVVVCTPKCAVITRPGVLQRREEIKGLENVLPPFYDEIKKIEAPGILEGGDVLLAGSHCFIGISERTNHAGADQLTAILQQQGITATTVPIKDMLHLKTGVVYLENNTLLVNSKYQDHPAFRSFNKIIADTKEASAANSMWINGTVIVPAGYPVTRSNLEDAGYKTVAVDISEFEKLDGGLTCLSIRF
ncbi:MAG: arginine deiminase family protein [Balneolaceae bacterium]